MRICENCKKEFQDDMNYCPYCGEKYHDYKEDLKEAMDQLFEEKELNEKTILEENEQTKTTISRVQRQTSLREEKKNQMLQKILIAFIAFIAIVLFAGILLLSKDWFTNSNKNSNPPIADNKNENQIDAKDDAADDTKDDIQGSKKDEVPVIDEKEDVIDEDKEKIDVEDQQNEDFRVSQIQVIKQENQIRLEVHCYATLQGELYLKDEGSLSVGPLQVQVGENEFYFEVSGNANYTLTFESSNAKVDYPISLDMLLNSENND